MRSWQPTCDVMRLIYADIIIKILYKFRSTPPYFFIVSGLNVKMFSLEFGLELKYYMKKMEGRYSIRYLMLCTGVLL